MKDEPMFEVFENVTVMVNQELGIMRILVDEEEEGTEILNDEYICKVSQLNKDGGKNKWD